MIVKPATVVGWHRQGFRLFWRRRSRAGRPRADREVRDLIRQMSVANPLWGAPRIHGELLKLGFQVSQARVAKYMVRRVGVPPPTYRSFLRDQLDGISAIDMFVVATASFLRSAQCDRTVTHRAAAASGGSRRALYNRCGAAFPIRSPGQQACGRDCPDRGPTQDVPLVQSRARIHHAGPCQCARLELIRTTPSRPRELPRFCTRRLGFEEPQQSASVLIQTDAAQ